MRVRVRLFSHLVRWAPSEAAAEGGILDLPEGATIRVALAGLGMPTSTPRVVTVNDTNSDEGHVLHDGDSLKVFPLAMGG